MKYKILGVIGVLWGGGMIAHGLKNGLGSGTPYASGSTAAFGFGVLMLLAGASALWSELNGRDASIDGGGLVLMAIVAAGVTFAVVKWGPAKHPSVSECEQMMSNVRQLVHENDPSGRRLAEFDAEYDATMLSCTRSSYEEYKCLADATSREDVAACPY